MTMRLLLDTNAWIDYFIFRSERCTTTTRLVGKSYESENLQLCTAIASTVDVYYMIQRELKRVARERDGELTESAAHAANETAWACLQSLRKLSYIVPADESDVIEAFIMRNKHPDYEDNLIAAAAKRAGARCIMTSDEGLLKRQPYPCITVEEALALLEEDLQDA
ncbi:MAG: PIN domain-containing protein [Eggerthellaceae bacterium]|nr:PIN domain-containing protein [Eggerthellaceae bacterium]